MNDELPVALLIMMVGLGLTAFCAMGILREFRAPPAGRTSLGMVVLASTTLIVGLAIIGAGALYLDVMMYSTDL